MLTIQVFPAVYLVLFLYIVNSGNAVFGSSLNDWKPITSQVNRIYSRSYSTQQNVGSTPSALADPSGTTASKSSPSLRSRDVILNPSPSQTPENVLESTYRSHENQVNGRSSQSTQGPTLLNKEEIQSSKASPSASTGGFPSRSSFKRSLNIQVDGRSTSSQYPSDEVSSVNSARSLRRSFDTQGDTGRAYSSNWLQSSLNALKAFSQENKKFQEAKRNPSMWPIAPKIDVAVTTETAPSKHFESEDHQNEETNYSSQWIPSSESAEYRVLKRVIDECLKSDDSVDCLKGKTVTFLDRISRVKDIPLFEGISLTRLQNANIQQRVSNDLDSELDVGRDLNDKSNGLDQMIYDRLINFWNSHKIQVDFSPRSAGEGK